MHDLDILSQLKRKVGRSIRHEVEGESVVGLSLTSDDFVFQGLIRHHTVSEKAEILSLIARLTSLRKLDLRRCMVFATPDEMSNLVDLTHLDLGSNFLGEVPAWIEKIKDLRYLNLAVNRLHQLPGFLAKFVNLRTFLVHKNNLRAFPEEFSGFRNLDYLNLYLNQIADIPAFVWRFKRLRTFSWGVSGSRSSHRTSQIWRAWNISLSSATR